jgi:DivIVA domain-containing protein
MTVTYRNDERLTPDLVQSVSFPAARLGRRGYDEEHVRAFCEQVHQELVTLLNEKAALWEEVDRLRRRIADDGSMEAGYRPGDAHIQAVSVLSSAQQTADRYVADAQQYSRQLAEDARRRRDEVIAEARSHAERLLEEAHAQASHAAVSVMSAPPAPGSERRDSEAELAYLRTFSDVYRTHLRAYLEALLRNVEDWERAEKSSVAAARAELMLPPAPGLP